MSMNNKYELTLATFPKAVVYQPGGNIMAHPTPSGEPSVLAFLSVNQATEFIDGLSSSEKVSGPCKVVSVEIRDWIPFAEALLAVGVKHIAVAQETGGKMAVVPLADLLEAATECAPGLAEPGRDEGTGVQDAGGS